MSTTPRPVPSSASGAPSLLTPIRRRGLLAEGYSDHEIATQRHSGTLQSLRPGLYLPGVEAHSASAAERHRALISGFAGDLVAGSIVSHTSAAVMFGLPLWNVPLRRLHVTRQRRAGGHRSAWVHMHAVAAELPVAHVDGIQVTSPAQTVIDCARILPFEQGVILADSALHRALVTPAELEEALVGVRGCAGARRAAHVVGFADGLSESVGESRSRVMFRQLGLPAMQLQHHIYDEDRTEVARVDFAIPELRIAGEFDGRVKYGQLLKPGQTPGEAVFAEKRREDAIRHLRWIVIRWVWEELDTPGVVERRWRQAIDWARNL